jgi:hypothetical protein
LKPCGLHGSGHVKIALPGHVRQVVMLEGHASALQGPQRSSTSSATNVTAVALLVPAYCEP